VLARFLPRVRRQALASIVGAAECRTCGAHDYDIVFRKDDATIDIPIEAPGVESRASLSAKPDGGQGTPLTFRVFVRPTG